MPVVDYRDLHCLIIDTVKLKRPFLKAFVQQPKVLTLPI
jgi:hypothetical protein